MKKLTLLSLMLLTAAVGCQQDTTKKTTGSYSATRHHQIGSHVPQAYDAESASQAYNPDQMANSPSRQSSINGGAAGSIGGGR